MTGVYLALRRTHRTGAGIAERVFCWLIRARLVSRWCHAPCARKGGTPSFTITNIQVAYQV